MQAECDGNLKGISQCARILCRGGSRQIASIRRLLLQELHFQAHRLGQLHREAGLLRLGHHVGARHHLQHLSYVLASVKRYLRRFPGLQLQMPRLGEVPHLPILQAPQSPRSGSLTLTDGEYIACLSPCSVTMPR